MLLLKDANPAASAGGIGNVVNTSSAFSVSYAGSAATYTFAGTVKTNCNVVYTQATNASTPATVVATTSGC